MEKKEREEVYNRHTTAKLNQGDSWKVIEDMLNQGYDADGELASDLEEWLQEAAEALLTEGSIFAGFTEMAKKARLR